MVLLVLLPVLLVSNNSYASALQELEIETSLIGSGVYGFVYDDSNNNGVRDLFEKGFEGVVMYVDENDNGRREANEPYGTTQRNGFYLINDLSAGEHIVRQEMPFGYRAANSEVESNTDVEIKIIGGDTVNPGEYPFMVSVGFDGGFGHSHFCGGSIISERFIVTAAHCTIADPELLSVICSCIT